MNLKEFSIHRQKVCCMENKIDSQWYVNKEDEKNDKLYQYFTIASIVC